MPSDTRVETGSLAVRALWSTPGFDAPVRVEDVIETDFGFTGRVVESEYKTRHPGLDEVIASLEQLRAMFLASQHAASSIRAYREEGGRKSETLPLAFSVKELRIGSLEIVVGLFGGFATSMAAIATFMALFNKAALSPMKLKTAWRREELEQAKLKVELARAEAEYERLTLDLLGNPLQLEGGSLEEDAADGP